MPLEHTLSYLRFLRRGRVQHLLHQLKYQGQREVGTVLGQWYGHELREHGLAGTFDLLVPVPLHPRKLAKRGYNQADCVAEGLALGLQTPWTTGVLRRTLHTASQTRKTRVERWHNVATVFEVAAPAPRRRPAHPTSRRRADHRRHPRSLRHRPTRRRRPRRQHRHPGLRLTDH